MAKRSCLSDHSPRVSKRDYYHLNIDSLLESLLAVSDSALIEASFDGLVESRSAYSDQNEFIQRALHIGSVLLEVGKRYGRKLSSVHNASFWPLPPDLTIKVFSMLDTPSVCSASATCLFFQNCAKDPLCFANIDLAIPKVNVVVVTTMIQRARNALQSIKLVEVPPELSLNKQGKKSSILTRSCLGFLGANGGASGSHLKRLHLHNIKMMDNTALLASLSVCPSLVDLEIVGLDVDASSTLKFVSRHCRLIERFVFDLSKSKDSMGRLMKRRLFDDEGNFIGNSACEELVLNCPKITTLALKGCRLSDYNAHKLLKGFHELKYVDFSTSCFFSGSFLNKGDGNNLEVMILRNCSRLKKVEVKKLMKALLAGKFRLLRHLDISNDEDIAYNGHLEGVSAILIKQLLEQRPNFCLVPEFSKLNSVNHMMDDDLSSPTSDASSSTSTSTSSDSSSSMSTSTTSDSSSSTSTSSSS
ncbi:F-box protein At4g02760 isoform X1 [Lactuca sativa]|nr:F-box protein At4g02760 isoform X1 [Lactuca sativa]